MWQITLPASFFEDSSKAEDEIIAEAKEKDMTAVRNDDGSYTYKMSKSTQKNIIAEYKKMIDDTIHDILNDSTYTSYKDIKYNEDLTKVSLYVDYEQYENSFLDGFAILGLYIEIGFYQLFDGVDESNMKTTFEFINNDTQEVFHTIVYPDDFGE